MAQKILVATTNPGKMKELSTLLGEASVDIDWISLAQYPDLPEVVEDGDTFIANARKKALGYAQATGLWTIADDSGLVVDALDGRPGVYSARYAADECDSGDRGDIDIANYQKVLAELKDIPKDQRTARFMCQICVANPEKVLLESTGSVEGIIIDEPVGDSGFGYDPIFYIPSAGKTAAQLDHDVKNQISHRGNAIAELKPKLQALLKA
ncbi:MAG: XTP/dITP diphosphatase [Planctomycetota bacterium]|jgi:XTP/dITP diphosphohydrolase